MIFGEPKFICLSLEAVPYLMDCVASYPLALIFHYNVNLRHCYQLHLYYTPSLFTWTWWKDINVISDALISIQKMTITISHSALLVLCEGNQLVTTVSTFGVVVLQWQRFVTENVTNTVSWNILVRNDACFYLLTQNIATQVVYYIKFLPVLLRTP